MSKATFPLKLPTSIKMAAARLAKQDGVSLNQWIATAVAYKVGAVETAAEFFKHRANGRTADDLDEILVKVPNNPPEPGDELPKGWSAESVEQTLEEKKA
ncbi:MAG: toxin-antitoxin system HicB family antitoxin [Pseudomonadota bacterium]|nr:toxin-antitoxin system HicB family antitoxin [Pseudomonadota bacterium]